MNSDMFLKQAEREGRFVDALLLIRYALTVHDGLTVLGDDGNRVGWPLDFCFELKRIDDVLQMAGIDTTEPLWPPLRSLRRDAENTPTLPGSDES